MATNEERLGALERKTGDLEARYEAHERLLRTSANELERQGKMLGALTEENEKALRESHHDIEVGLEMKVEQVRMDMQKQIVDAKYLRKENRALGLGLAGLLFVGWILNRVETNAATVVGLVSALLAAIALFWQQLSKNERRAKDSIAPPPPRSR